MVILLSKCQSVITCGIKDLTWRVKLDGLKDRSPRVDIQAPQVIKGSESLRCVIVLKKAVSSHG